MSYQLAYYFSFTDVHISSPKDWTVNIYRDSEDTITPVELTMAESPFILSRPNSDDDPFVGLIGSEADINIVIDGAVDPEDFFTAKAKELRVDLIEGESNLKWQGFVVPDQCTYNITGPVYGFTINAKDFLGIYKDYPFDYHNVSVIDSTNAYWSIWDIFFRLIIQDIGLVKGLNIINYIKNYDTSSISDSVFKNANILFDAFYDFYDLKTNGDILTNVCKVFASCLYQSDGKWWFIRPNDLSNDTVNIQEYSDDGTSIDYNENVNNVKQINFSDDNFVIFGSANVTLRSGIGIIEYLASHQKNNLIRNPAFNFMMGDVPTFWSLDDLDYVTRVGTGTSDDPYCMKILYKEASTQHHIEQIININPLPIIHVGTNDYTKGKYNIDLSFDYQTVNNSVENSIKITLLAGNASSYTLSLEDDGYFRAGTGSAINANYDNEQGGWQSFSISTSSDNIPAFGDFNDVDRFDLIISFLNDSESSSFLLIKNPKIEITYIDQDLNGAGGTPGQYVPVTDFGNKYIYNDDFKQKISIDGFFTDSADVTSPQFNKNKDIIYVKDSVLANDWKWKVVNDPEMTDTYRLYELAMYSQLKFYSRVKKMMDVQIYANHFDFHNQLQIDLFPDKTWMQIADEYDIKNCTHNLRLIEC